MTLLILVFISFTYTTQVLAQSRQCPNGDGYYPDTAHGCRKFYVCEYSGKSNQKISSFDCPRGLLFNRLANVCDWPQNVNCKSLKDVVNKCPNGDGYYPDIENGCRKFYVCEYYGTSNQKITSFDCPSGLLFNSIAKVCDWPQNVNCNKLKAVTNQWPNGDGYYADTANGCRKFYICLNSGRKNQMIYSLDCPSGLLFNSVSKVCDWPQNVVCKNVSVSINTCAFGDGYYSDVSNACRKFYVCKNSAASNQIIYNYECPNGLLFNGVTKFCDLPQKVNCNLLTSYDSSSKSSLGFLIKSLMIKFKSITND